MEYLINLTDFQEDNVVVFVGIDKGNKFRKITNIDIIEPFVKKITIIIPKNTRSINPSFLEGFFGNIIKRLGRVEFKNKVNFIGFDVERDLTETLYRIKFGIPSERVVRKYNQQEIEKMLSYIEK